MRKLGLIGNPLKHSFSEKYFGNKFQKLGLESWSYELFPLPSIDSLPKLLATNPSLHGLNITIPYKQEALKYIHELDAEATQIGAINTIAIQKDGKLKGYNTDVIGFENSVKPFLGDNAIGMKALILGSGGAAQAIKFVLDKMSIPHTTVSRSASNGTTYSSLDKEAIDSNQLIINCTPLGTYPNIETAPELPYEYMTSKHFLYDLVYNPEKTLFLRRGEEQGAKTMNGYSMLEMQAEASWEIWNKD